MDDRTLIYAVDGDVKCQEFLQKELRETYTIHCMADGRECLERVSQTPPDLILLAVHLPDMEGLALFQQLSADENLPRIPVIFLSPQASLEERVACYHAGGEGYLTKPIHSEELHAKIQLTLKNKSLYDQLKHDALQANEVAMSAMTTSGEMGEVLRFLQDSYACNDHHSLAELVVNTLNQLGLKGLIRLAGENPETSRHTTSFLPSLEMMILKNIYANRRIMTVGKSTLFTAERTLILVQDMPVEDQETFGRLKDILAMMVESVDARVAALQTRLKLAEREKTLALLLQNQTKESQQAQQRLQDEVQMAQQVALSAMTTSGELGEVLRFLQDSYLCPDDAALANEIFITLEGLGLEGVVGLIQDRAVAIHTRESPLRPGEQAVLEEIDAHDRIMIVGKSTLFTSERVLILVHDLVEQDEESFGRLKDILATLIVSANARSAALQTTLQLAQREKSLSSLLDSLEKAVVDVRNKQTTVRDLSVERFSKMVWEIEESFNHLGIGLSDEQEHALMRIISRCETDIMTLNNIGQDLEHHLFQIANKAV
ncbi:MAG: response regulator [Magnetococcales bacterium]|nr:response regulator [Magnetococcales bacterium]